MIWIVYIDNRQRDDEHNEWPIFACTTEQEATAACTAWVTWQNSVLAADRDGWKGDAPEKRREWIEKNPAPFGQEHVDSFNFPQYLVGHYAVPMQGEYKS